MPILEELHLPAVTRRGRQDQNRIANPIEAIPDPGLLQSVEKAEKFSKARLARYAYIYVIN